MEADRENQIHDMQASTGALKVENKNLKRELKELSEDNDKLNTQNSILSR